MIVTSSNSDMLGNSACICMLREAALAVAGRRSTVMISGETGTGKELQARFIHLNSDRAAASFVAVDCSTLNETLFESQMFGHVKGSFTGAFRESAGFIRTAHRGTLFLDEIGELALPLQAKLLRVLQERCVVPLGDVLPQAVDIRVVVATHRNLGEMVRAGTFRQDLYFRLNVVTMVMPALRERRDDILPLAQHFLRAQADLYGEVAKALSREAIQALLRYDWPGNVRELANVMERMHVNPGSNRIDAVDVAASLPMPVAAVRADLCLREIEREAISEALRRAKQNKTNASELLGIDVRTLNRRLATLQLD